MKSFMISLGLLAVLLSGVLINHLYIKDVFAHMSAEIDALPDVGDADCPAAVQDLASYWDRQIDLVSLSVSYPIVDRICEHVATLLACAECNDLFGYRTALALLRDALGDMMRFEAPSIGTLL